MTLFPDPDKLAFYSDYYMFGSETPDGAVEFDIVDNFTIDGNITTHLLRATTVDVTRIDAMVLGFATSDRTDTSLGYDLLPQSYTISVLDGTPKDVYVNINYKIQSNGQLILSIRKGGLANGTYPILDGPRYFRAVYNVFDFFYA